MNIVDLSFIGGTSNRLPGLGADPGMTTISGWSGGSFMATNLHVIYSDTIKGSGTVNGAGYAYGESYPNTGGIFDYYAKREDLANGSYEVATRYSEEGRIDPISNLQNQPVISWTGKRDNVIHATLQEGMTDFFERAGSNVKINIRDTGHVWATDVKPRFWE